LEKIPVLGSQPASDVSRKPGGRLPLLSTRPTVTLAILKRAATNFAAILIILILFVFLFKSIFNL